MIYLNAEAGSAPAKVVLEDLPEKKIVRLADNVTTHQTEDEIPQTVYRFDEVVFDLPEDRQGESGDSIEANFDQWWAFGSEDEAQVTLEDRVAALEDMFLATLEM